MDKFPKEIKGLEEKLNRMTRLKAELGNKGLNEKIEEIEAYLLKELKDIESFNNGARETEPSEYNDMLKASNSKEVIYPVTNYKDRLKGAMFGRFAGCALGAPVELLSIGELEYFAKETDMSFPPMYYWKKAPNGYFPRYKVGKGNHFTSELMSFLSTDDDIAYTFLSMLIMEEFGLDFTTEDVAKLWVKHLPEECTFTAERVTLQNLKKGISPLTAGVIGNPDTEFIGASIRCDGYGYVAPGNPLLASKLAYKDAYLSHRKSGIYSAMYFAAVISLAFTASSLEEALVEGLHYIPTNTYFHQEISWAITKFNEIKNYKEANRVVSERYPGMSWVHAVNNAVLTVWGILFGKEGFDKGISETVASAYDNDCTAATVGSVLGAFYGINHIDEKWYKPWNNKALSYLNGIESFDLENVLARFNTLKEKN